MKENIKKFLRHVFLINDTPHKIALGAFCGVFWGALPGTGPALALAFAFLIRANRISAIAFGFLFNIWTNFVFFPLAVKIGAIIFGVSTSILRQEAMHILKDFHWADFLKIVMGKYFLILMTGYAVTSFGAGIVIYGVVFAVISWRRAYKIKEDG